MAGNEAATFQRYAYRSTCFDGYPLRWITWLLRFSHHSKFAFVDEYLSFALQNAKASIPQKSRGFLISCIGGKEFQAAKEAMNVLTEVRTTFCEFRITPLELHIMQLIAYLVICRLQFYEKLHPNTAAPLIASAKDIAAAIADEVADLKTGDSQLFTYHKTNIHGMIYLTMRDDAGAQCNLENAH